MAAILFLALLVVLGAAVLLGGVPDTRNPEFSLGRVFARRAGRVGG